MTAPRSPRKSTSLVAKARELHEAEIVEETVIQRLPRARTPEAREQQLVALAYDLAEQQLLKGTASSQVISHLLKVGSIREKQELEKLKQETILTEAKVKDLANVEDLKILFTEAMDAFRGYGGHEVNDSDSNIFGTH